MSILAIQPAAQQLSRSSFFSMIRRGGTLIVRPTGPRLGEGEATVICPDVKNAIDDLGGGFRGLVLDLSEVTVMSSYGLGLCIELRNHARQRRCETVLFGLCPDLRELFRIMKVDRLFAIALNEQQVAEAAG